jgi:uncharacterized membrane protein YhdT
MKGQSVKVRRQRIERGCCPTHGLSMSQIDGVQGRSCDDLFPRCDTQNLNSKVPQLFFLVLLSLIIAVCIQPVARRLLGGTAGFGQAFQIACLLISFSFVLVSIAVVFATALFGDILKLRRGKLLGVYNVTVLLPRLLILCRSFLGSFSELYDLSYLRIIAASFGGFVAECHALNFRNS